MNNFSELLSTEAISKPELKRENLFGIYSLLRRKVDKSDE